MTPEHLPVLLGPAVESLRVLRGGGFLDATVGTGGHAAEILRRLGPSGRFFGIDKDAQALARAAQRLSEFGDRVRLAQGNFTRFAELFPEIGAEGLDGILLDLGVSSLQLDDPARGFSFQREGPLDMRMDRSQGETALSYLQRVSPEELEERLCEAGEIRFAKRLADRLLREGGQWNTTRDLATAIERIVPQRGRSHPATRVFLALRMAVNREMENLREFLQKAPMILKSGGRMGVITFHSTEDRIVKRFFSDVHRVLLEMRPIGKSPVLPSQEEQRLNPRSRSAKMRIFEKK